MQYIHDIILSRGDRTEIFVMVHEQLLYVPGTQDILGDFTRVTPDD